MTLSDILKINIKSIRYNWKKDLGSILIMSLVFCLFFATFVGSFSYNNTLNIATKDTKYGVKNLESELELVNPSIPINKSTELLMGLTNVRKNSTPIASKVCGFEMLAPIMVTEEAFGSNNSLGFPCFAKGDLYDSFVVSGTLSPRNNKKIPILIPSSFVRTNPNQDHVYTKNELQESSNKIIGKSFQFRITKPADNEFINYFSPFVFDYFTKPDVLEKINENIKQRIVNAQKANFEVVVVGFVKEQRPNIIFPDWFIQDNSSNKLTNSLTNFQETKLFETDKTNVQYIETI